MNIIFTKTKTTMKKVTHYATMCSRHADRNGTVATQ